MVIEIRNDVVAALQHFARSFGETRLVAIDQRQGPGASEVKEQAGEKNENEISEADISRVFAIYRSCRIQGGTQK